MNWWRSIPAVLGAFIGIRRQRAAQRDVRLSALQIVVTAFVLAGCLVGLLIVLVSWVTAA